MSEVQKWSQPVEIVEIDRSQREADLAKERAARVLAEATINAVNVVIESLEDDDAQVRLRAAEIMLSRTIPKVAAKHVDTSQDAIDSVDTVAMREEIEELIRKNGR